MQLTKDQQAVVEQAIVVVPKAIVAFSYRYPTLRKRLSGIDSTSVAYLAICKAAITYDPAKSAVTTYFSMAIRNALLKELDKERRYRYDAANRVPMALAEELATARKSVSTKLQTAMARLPAKPRRLLYMRFFKSMSLREIGEQLSCDPRTIRRRLAAALESLQTLLQNDPLLP